MSYANQSCCSKYNLTASENTTNGTHFSTEITKTAVTWNGLLVRFNLNYLKQQGNWKQKKPNTWH